MATNPFGKPLAIAVAVAIGLASVHGSTPSAYRFRNFDGTENNKEDPDLNWGAVGENQLRGLAEADYVEDGNSSFLPPGDDRPTSREIMSEVFLSSNGSVSPKNALFVAFGQLVTIDMSLTLDNASEPFDVPCNAADIDPVTGSSTGDIWCPDGEDSDPIPFYRSSASLSSTSESLFTTSNSELNLPERTRNPINYATAFLDLDFMYGRDEATAESLRTFEGGRMLLDDNSLPVLNEDGTWKIADQRTARYPVTFALHVAFLREHNRCCVEVAPHLGFSGDEDLYIACRRWTIASYQHIHEEDFAIQLLDGNVFTLGTLQQVTAASGCTAEIGSECYDPHVNAGADVFALTVGTAAFESAIPSTVRVLRDGFDPVGEDMTDLLEVSKNLPEFVRRNGIGPILRGAVLSKAGSVDAYYPSSLSNLSPLFKLPVDAVQRGRDHGLPTYNDARRAYGLGTVSSFADMPVNDPTTKALLSDTYGGEIDNLDAFVGAIAEKGSHGRFFGDLLQEAWLDQVYRAIVGDGLYHNHSEPIEDVELMTMSELINRTTDAHDIPLVAFRAPDFTVCSGICSIAEGEAILSDAFELRWQVVGGDVLDVSLRGKLNADNGWLGIGFGGLEMTSAVDFLVCEVTGTELEDVTCADRQGVDERTKPLEDTDDFSVSLDITELDVGPEWTQVTFKRKLNELDADQDYDIKTDFFGTEPTEIVFAYRQGSGLDQHPSSNRGSATVVFSSGLTSVGFAYMFHIYGSMSKPDRITTRPFVSQGFDGANGSSASLASSGGTPNLCDDDKSFYALHGALMLVAWMVVAPVGVYFARYRKGHKVMFGRQWYGAHAEIMVVASEAVLPLAITAIFATSGDTSSTHARWGLYMIAAVSVQLLTGWLRTKALEGDRSNFSQLHRINKHFHIWAGRCAYLAGVLQCYRGVSMVSPADNVIFSALEIEIELTSFGAVESWLFPAWTGVLFLAFIYFEMKKQSARFIRKGEANILGCISLINSNYGNDKKHVERLVPRTEELPLYTTEEFNDKVLRGQSWVLIDNAVIDISTFSLRHPGGRRLLLNAVGTDVTHEILGQDLSVGTQMAFNPHFHSQTAWEIVRALVVGYIDEGGDADEAIDSVQERQVMDSVTTATTDDVHHKGDNGNKGNGHVAFKASAPVRFTFGSNSSDISLITKTPLQFTFASASKADNNMPKAAEAAPQSSKMVGSSSGTGLEVVTDAQVVSTAKVLQWSDRSIGKSHSVAAEKETVLLKRFHVCPLLFREKMSSKSATRPVFKYVFSFPGVSSVMVKSISGPCYFNLRLAQEGGKGVVQRSYNAFPVYLKGQTPDAYTRLSPRPGPCETVTAMDTRDNSEGEVCVEMWIRHVNDGVMSRMLDRLAKDIDNPAVQLQGPFIRRELTPPPAHRNVVMIAAGTGINPMVQTIHYYQELARTDPHSKARIHVVWQNSSKEDFFCDRRLMELQKASQGLLDVRGLVSGDQRPRNRPGAAFLAAKSRFRLAISPAPSSSNSNAHSFLSSVDPSPKPGLFPTIVKKTSGIHGHRALWKGKASPAPAFEIPRPRPGNSSDVLNISIGDIMEESGASMDEGSTEGRVREEAKSEVLPNYGGGSSPQKLGSRDSPPLQDVAMVTSSKGMLHDIGSILRGKSRTTADKVQEQSFPRKKEPAASQISTLSYGKVTRDVLLVAFGEALVRTLDELNQLNSFGQAPKIDTTNVVMSRHEPDIDDERKVGNDALEAGEDGDEERSTQMSSDATLFKRTEGEMLDYICGTEIAGGQLSVIVSGPRGFVFDVERLLDEMGVPRRAVIILD